MNSLEYFDTFVSISKIQWYWILNFDNNFQEVAALKKAKASWSNSSSHSGQWKGGDDIFFRNFRICLFLWIQDVLLKVTLASGKVVSHSHSVHGVGWKYDDWFICSWNLISTFPIYRQSNWKYLRGNLAGYVLELKIP